MLTNAFAVVGKSRRGGVSTCRRAASGDATVAAVTLQYANSSRRLKYYVLLALLPWMHSQGHICRRERPLHATLPKTGHASPLHEGTHRLHVCVCFHSRTGCVYNPIIT